MFTNYLVFSDVAKFADIARSLVGGSGYVTSFNFWQGNNAPWISPVMPYSIAGFFKIFGVSDFAVIATSFFYFLLTLVFTFLLARGIYKSNLVAWLSTIAVGFNYSLIQYATGGASESPFIFEIVAASYFVTLKKKWGPVVTGALLILMYFTRPQAFIYIAGIIFYWLLTNFNSKKAILYFLGICGLGFLFDKFVLSPLSGRFFIYSVLGRGANVLSQVAVSQSASEQLRSGVITYNFALIESFKKVFYNLYNFYKLLPQIINPYFFTLFIVGLFSKAGREFKIAAGYMAAATFLVTAASIPFFRYIHPVVPLVYIVAIGTLVWIIEKISDKKKFVVLVSCLLVLFLGVGQTLGVLILDSRFERNTHNVGQPPVYVRLSRILKEQTGKEQIIVTNLDTWGSWYGERKTVWFPLEPKQLIDSGGEIPFDAIYLTSYLIDDDNYRMGESWRMIFDNPKDSSMWTCEGCETISKEFALKGVYEIDANDNYERQNATAVLLVKND